MALMLLEGVKEGVSVFHGRQRTVFRSSIFLFDDGFDGLKFFKDFMEEGMCAFQVFFDGVYCQCRVKYCVIHLDEKEDLHAESLSAHVWYFLACFDSFSEASWQSSSRTLML